MVAQKFMCGGESVGTVPSPIAHYISSPTTFLHRLDPRIKMAWLLALVILPAKSDARGDSCLFGRIVNVGSAYSGVEVFFTYIRRIFNHIYNHVAQITQAMIVRGFRGDCDSHRVLLLAGSSTITANIVSCSCLVGLIFAATLSKYVYL